MLISFSGSSPSSTKAASELASLHGIDDSDVIVKKDSSKDDYLNNELLDVTMEWIEYYI